MPNDRVLRVCLMLSLAALPLAAQSTSARLVIGGGAATDLRGVRSGAYAVAPSISLIPHPDFALTLGGRGTRFMGGEWSLGGSGAALLRIPFAAGLGVLLSGNGEMIRTSYRASYLSAEAVPAIEWRRGVLALWGGAHAATARTLLESSGLPLSRSGSVTRSLWGPAFGFGLRFAPLDRRSSVDLSYREEHGRPDGMALVDRTAGLGIARGAIALSGSLGLRSAADEQRNFGGVRLAITLTPSLALIGSAESYPSNRLTGTLGGRSFTAGMALGIGGPHRAAALPEPRGVPAVRPELTRLSFSAPDAARVEVAGDWNGWHAVPLARATNGVWYVDLAIPRGVYRYAFRIDGKTWEVPKGVAAVDDGFGGKSAWLSVSGPERTAAQSANRKEAP